MICKTCNILMKSGTAYKKDDKRGVSSKRFYECPKCHFKKCDDRDGGSIFQEKFAKSNE